MSVKLLVNKKEILYSKQIFSAGEPHISLGMDSYYSLDQLLGDTSNVEIILQFEAVEDIFDMLLLIDMVRAYKSNMGLEVNLYMPYLPFGRQDRRTDRGVPFSLKVFCNVLKLAKLHQITVIDPHSSANLTLLEDCCSRLKVIPQQEFIKEHLTTGALRYSKNTSSKVYLSGKESARPFKHTTERVCAIAPDAGAAQKISRSANAINVKHVITATKSRNVLTGKITSTSIESIPPIFDVAVVIDDLCDGGATFIELSKKIRENGFNGELLLYVTHGIFSKGLDELVEHYDSIYCHNLVTTRYVTQEQINATHSRIQA